MPPKAPSKPAKAKPAKASAKPTPPAPPDDPKVEETTAPSNEQEWLAAIEKMTDEEKGQPNERYPKLTNGDVAAVLRWQLVRSEIPEKTDLTPEQAHLLRDAAKVHRPILDALTKHEKLAVVGWENEELDEEQTKRKAEKTGLTGKARFLWVIYGLTSQQQRELAAAEGGDAPAKPRKQREEKPKRWREGTFGNMTDDLSGSLSFVAKENPLEGAELTFVGQFNDDEFYDKAHARIKSMGFDPDTCFVITLRGRNARLSRPPAPTSPDTAATEEPKESAKPEAEAVAA